MSEYQDEKKNRFITMDTAMTVFPKNFGGNDWTTTINKIRNKN